MTKREDGRRKIIKINIQLQFKQTRQGVIVKSSPILCLIFFICVLQINIILKSKNRTNSVKDLELLVIMKLLLLFTLCLVSYQLEGNGEAHAREENWGIANKTLNKDDFDEDIQVMTPEKEVPWRG